MTKARISNTERNDRHFLSQAIGNTFSYYDNMPNVHYENILNFDNDISINLSYQITKDLDKPILVCVVIPTYNEVQNILKLLRLIYSKKQKIEYDKKNILMNVLVVDDNSPDGTAEVVKTYQKHNPNIHILSRNEKNGLGEAYIAGMQHAMKLLNPTIIFEMDADLSHDPEYILPMISKIREGADFVIGSRYVKGGSIPANWGIKRKLLSKSANIYAKTLLRIKDVNDCTGGFRAIRTSKLKNIDFSSLKTKGYAFQISLLEAMRKNNAIMGEVPIAFKDRTNGTSKMRLYDIIEEGFFVFKASLENTFLTNKMPSKKEQDEQFLANGIGYRFELNPEYQSVMDQTEGLEESVELGVIHNQS